ncbi:hypothetical protein EIP91_010962 [Steccherinum ochraceum]|uniref:Zn(2)-C6 fungal-type domain-containing protein n=1 Tax=Steccherinum ochraceum TaxID=92696 RepID=A0A4R0RYR6_9APHY|nr:hypothetical protein EIP91_010962 [Steccherinum ochraceum]
MSSDSSQDSHISPLQFKGEIMDFDLGVEVDHRKRRRNRTTQSCLNCHTSKRKCDRKRPCQRCIQLGLTGLCVYEVDDPALRDDPNIDESTRLRNRIAELESLVRELRGKPHPRWAEPNFCDGDASEKWHSRSSKRAQFHRQKREYPEDGVHGMENPLMSSIVKVEPSAEATQRRLYRLSPSPPSMNYNGHHQHPQQHHVQGDCSPVDDTSMSSTGYPSPSSNSYHGRQPGPSSITMPNNDLYYHQPYIRPADSPQVPPSCTCVTNPAAGHPLIGLTHQLQNALHLLRQLPEHSNRHQQCIILRRITELNDLLHGGSVDTVPSNTHSSHYDGLPTPTESELMSPISASSHSSMNNHMPQEWSNMGTAAPSTSHYDTYFPVNAGEHGVYQKTYHIN